MADQITTKPFVSRAQWRMAFARGLPFARRWAKETPGGAGRRFRRLPIKKKAYSVDEFTAIALKDDSVATAIAALYTPELATLKGEQLAPGVTRIHGDLCNVHGRWGSCRAAGYGGAAPTSKRVPPKKLPAAPKPKAGKGRRRAAASARKPVKTEEQKRQEHEAKRAQAQQERAAEREQNRKDTVTKLRNQPNAASMEALARLERGEPIDPDMAQALAGETGLVELHQNGTATLSSTGRAFLHALDRGDVAAAEDAQARAQDRQVRNEDRAAAQAERKRAADERKAAIDARRAEAARKRAERLAKHKKGGGKGKKQPLAQPRQPRTPLPRSSGAPHLVRIGGGGSTHAPRPTKPKAPELPQNLIDAAQQLSAGTELDDATIALLIRNGLARYDKNGVLVLTSAGQRATKKEALYQPTRILTTGHTGVMVALHPDKQAARALVSTPDVTEPVEQLHLTLCYLGDSTEQPLVENKGQLIDTIQQWAVAQYPLQGAINGTGRFFHAESDGTNAVYVCPDVPGLPELRQSLVGMIEATGLDYARNHGFTPHITVAYVPIDAPTPPIRVEVPVAFDHVTLAWGDEQYDFSLGYPDQPQFAGYTTTKALNSDDYLVVEDRTKPSTWHLQVKRNGKPDHRLMGAAWAALHSGYRGNVYQGPNKAEALTKLKRLYASEKMPLPSEKSYSPQTQPVAAVAVPGVTVMPSPATSMLNTDRHFMQRTDSFVRGDVQRIQAYPHDGHGYSHASVPKSEAAACAADKTVGITSPPADHSTTSFAVFKDASGAYRWIARTTTAYRDRDGEIISEAALEDDAARMTATGQYGPLRYWHVGQPDPLNVDAPWGPGLDIGMCDYSTVIGRTSIESGTFKSEAIGRAFSETAAEFELSPGFFHAPTEPDAATGVFGHIRRFERSTVPIQHGRASNLFTGLTVKEHRMDQATYDKRVKAYLDFAREKGIPPEAAAAPIVAMQQADKAAAERGIAYKEEGDLLSRLLRGEQVAVKDERVTAKEDTFAVAAQWVSADQFTALKAELESLQGEIAALKAPSQMDTEDMADQGVDESAEGEPSIDEGGDGGLTLSSEDLAAIGQVVSTALAGALEPLVGALGITQKLDGHMGELKSLMAGYVKQKEAGDQQKADQVAALKAQIDQTQAALADSQAKLADLIGDQPRGGAYRPTEATDNTAAGMLAAALKGGPPDGIVQSGPFDDLIANLFPGLVPSQ